MRQSFCDRPCHEAARRSAALAYRIGTPRHDSRYSAIDMSVSLRTSKEPSERIEQRIVVHDPSPHIVCCSAGTCCGLREPIEGTVITGAAAPGWISWTALGSGTHTAWALSASITRAGIW